MRSTRFALAVPLSFAAASAFAADDGAPAPSDREAAIRILPVKDYSGELMNRSTLSGDWGGKRNDLAKKGIFVEADLVWTYQRIGSGGKEFDYNPRLGLLPSVHVSPDRSTNGGSFELKFDVDTGAAGLWPGGLVHAKFNSRWGGTSNDGAGTLSPTNTMGVVPTGDDDSEAAATAWTLTQFLSTKFGVSLGKFDTTEGDPNPFASNERDTFMNISLILPTVGLRTLPDSTLGGALIWLPCPGVQAQVLVADSEGTADRSGVHTVDDNGTTVLPMVSHTGGFFDLPGGQRLGGTWSNKEYVSGDQDARFPVLAAVLTGRPLERDKNSWCVFADGWQYAQTWADEKDLGWGVFWRVGAADQETNPIAHQWAGGVGGKGGFLCRKYDSWGVGAYYLDLSHHLGAPHLTDEKGLEAFYNIGITPWLHLTPSIQVVDPGIRDFDTTVIGSVRLQIDF